MGDGSHWHTLGRKEPSPVDYSDSISQGMFDSVICILREEKSCFAASLGSHFGDVSVFDTQSGSFCIFGIVYMLKNVKHF